MLYVSKLGICVVCYRIADMPAPKVSSVRQKCENCRAPIWVAKGSPAGPPKLCLAGAKHFVPRWPKSVGTGISVGVADAVNESIYCLRAALSSASALTHFYL